MPTKLPINVLDLLRQRTVESERIEYKAGWNPDPIMRTVCAFANDFQNLGGGYVVIGQDCDANGRPVFPPVGLEENQLDKIQRELLAYCQLMQPPYNPALSVETVDGRKLVVLWVPGGANRPYKVPDRVTAKQKAHRHYIRRYTSTVEVEGADEALHPKNVGLLFFNEAPHRFLPYTQIDVVWFPEGTGGGGLEERVFKGPLGRMTREALDHIHRNYLYEIVTKLPQQAEALRVWNFPFAAVEEAVVNAVYHRSYQEREPVEVRISREELVVLSFPGPDRSITAGDLAAGRLVSRRYRNRRIGEFLKEMKLTEGRATGIPNIMKAMAANGSPPPVFESDPERTSFVIRLPAHPLATRHARGAPPVEADLDKLDKLDSLDSLDNCGSSAGSVHPAASAHPAHPVRVLDVTHLDGPAPPQLFGRDAETGLLSEAWEQVVSDAAARPKVLALVGFAGEGKTALLAKWLANMEHAGWPGCEAVFAWSFNRQDWAGNTASSDAFLAQALAAFGEPTSATGGNSGAENGRRLAQLLGARRTLLVLDGLEPFQCPPTAITKGALTDKGIAALLTGLAGGGKGLCVLSTRLPIPDLQAFPQGAVREVALSRLAPDAGAAMLASLGVRGKQQECADAVEAMQGHALTLRMMGSFLSDVYGGDIAKRSLVSLEEADLEETGGRGMQMAQSYARWLEADGERGARAMGMLRLLSLFDGPAGAASLNTLLAAPAAAGLVGALAGASGAQRNLVLTRLAEARLVAVERDADGGLISVDMPPLLREYVASGLRASQAEAWRAGRELLRTPNP